MFLSRERSWLGSSQSTRFSRAAGKALVRGEDIEYFQGHITEYFAALETINNFRASHAFPLNTFQINLRSVSKRFDSEALVAQRIKRMASIAQKLVLRPSMKLSQMQDLGGCRAIVQNISAVMDIVGYYFYQSGIKHMLASYDNYIDTPKPSGYRGVHLVYRYFSDKSEVYNGMKIELQIRSRYQHAWATAVETVGMFSGQECERQGRRFHSLRAG